jgi:hypothetical protein
MNGKGQCDRNCPNCDGALPDSHLVTSVGFVPDGVRPLSRKTWFPDAGPFYWPVSGEHKSCFVIRCRLAAIGQGIACGSDAGGLPRHRRRSRLGTAEQQWSQSWSGNMHGLARLFALLGAAVCNGAADGPSGRSFYVPENPKFTIVDSAIAYTEPFLNNQHVAEPTLYYLEHFASKSAGPQGTEWRDCEASVILRRKLPGQLK